MTTKAATQTVESDGETKFIECKRISFPKNDPALRKFSKEFATNLATAIAAEGMYNAIVVRPDPNREGYFIGVQGRHRHYAQHKVLKQPLIECKVIADMDDTEHEMAVIAENLWRNPLTKGQQTISVKRWYEHYQKLHPDLTASRGAAGGAATKAKLEAARQAEANGDANGEAEATARRADASEATESTEAKKSESGFPARVASATGQSLRTAERELRLAKAFTEEQLEVFEQMKVTQAHREQIARVKDEGERGAIVNLIASGMEAEEAIKQVMQDRAPTRADKSKAEIKAESQAKADKGAADMDDETWFNTYCGEKAAMFGDPAKYKADAILYRKVAEQRATFRSKVKGFVKATKDSKILGPFFNNLHRLIGISHPKDWPLCGTCGGKGSDETKLRCKKCYGCCYELKTEEYL